MNLPSLKSAAEKAKTSSLELEIWQMEISPDDVLRLVEVARAAIPARKLLEEECLDSLINEAEQHRATMGAYRPARQAGLDALVVQCRDAIEALKAAMDGIE